MYCLRIEGYTSLLTDTKWECDSNEKLLILTCFDIILWLKKVTSSYYALW